MDTETLVKEVYSKSKNFNPLQSSTNSESLVTTYLKRYKESDTVYPPKDNEDLFGWYPDEKENK